jgi:hypothetical protein
MAAITGAVVALAGMGLSIGQAVKADKDKKKAEQAATVAANKMKSIKETNAFSSVQVPTLGFDLAQQGIDRSAMAALSSAEGAGAEGVLGASGKIMQGVKDAELELSAQAGDVKLRRDLAEAQAGSDIEARRADRENTMYSAQLQGAQADIAQQQANKNAAIQSAVGSAGNALSSGADALALYKGKKGEKMGEDLLDKSPYASGSRYTTGASY